MSGESKSIRIHYDTGGTSSGTTGVEEQQLKNIDIDHILGNCVDGADVKYHGDICGKILITVGGFLFVVFGVLAAKGV